MQALRGRDPAQRSSGRRTSRLRPLSPAAAPAVLILLGALFGVAAAASAAAASAAAGGRAERRRRRRSGQAHDECTAGLHRPAQADLHVEQSARRHQLRAARLPAQAQRRRPDSQRGRHQQALVAERHGSARERWSRRAGSGERRLGLGPMEQGPEVHDRGGRHNRLRKARTLAVPAQQAAQAGRRLLPLPDRVHEGPGRADRGPRQRSCHDEGRTGGVPAPGYRFPHLCQHLRALL